MFIKTLRKSVAHQALTTCQSVFLCAVTAVFPSFSPVTKAQNFQCENCKYEAPSLILSDSSVLARENIKWNRTACIMRAFDPWDCCRCEAESREFIRSSRSERRRDRQLSPHDTSLFTFAHTATIQLPQLLICQAHTREPVGAIWCAVFTVGLLTSLGTS